MGGPIKKDLAWFFFQFRDQGSHRTIPGMFANKNMGDPTKWTYERDTTRPAVAAGSWRNAALRVTVQPTPRNKFNVFWDQQVPCQGAGVLGSDAGCRQSGDDEIICGAAGASNPPCSATTAPEIGTYLSGYGQRVQQATWTSPATNKLLLEAGFGTYWSQWGGTAHPGSNFPQLVGVTEQCTAGCAVNGGIAGLQYRSGTYRQNFQGTIGWRGSASYVSGAHSMKFGYQGGHLIDDQFTTTNDQFYSIRVNNGVPNQITENINGIPVAAARALRVVLRAGIVDDGPDHAAGRAALRPRLELLPRGDGRPGSLLPEPRHLPEDGRRHRLQRPLAARRAGLGRARQRQDVAQGQLRQVPAGGAERPQLRAVAPDGPPDHHGHADVDRPRRRLHPRLRADQSAGAGRRRLLRQISDLGFGQQRFTSTLHDQLISGWGVRPGDWQIGVSVQQELMPRVSAEIGYQNRWLTNFTWTDNILQQSTDFATFSVTAPNDPRLPEEARGRVISGLYNVNQNVASQVNDVQTLASDFGTYSQTSHGILFNISARPRNGLVFQGGFSTGDVATDYCDVRAAAPEYTVLAAQSPTNPWCDTSTGWVTRYTGLGSYTAAEGGRAGLGHVPQRPGRATWRPTWRSRAAQTTLGRPFANNAPNVTVNLIEPGTLYGDRVNEIDFRFAKILRFGRTRTNVGFDVYNITNSAPILTYNQTFAPTAANHLADAEFGAPAAVLEVQRAVGLLKAPGSGLQAPGLERN